MRDNNGEVFAIGARPFPNGTRFYEEDFSTLDKFIEVLNYFNKMEVCIFKSGYEYLYENYDIDKLYEVTKYTPWHFGESIEEFEENFMYELSWGIEEVQIISRNDAINYLAYEIDIDKLPMLSDNAIKPNYEILKKIVLAIKNRIEENNYDLERFYDLFIFNKMELLDTEISKFDYNYNNIYKEICEIFKKDVDENAISKSLKLIEDFKYESDKPLEERNVPDTFKYDFVRDCFFDMDEIGSEDIIEKKLALDKFTDELVSKDEELGYYVKAYRHYGSNPMYETNYYESEKYLLELYYKFNDYEACNTLGYIYYYGRTNQGIPEYDKALKYYTIASLVGNVEAKYKLGDMYRNGFGVEKNRKLAYKIYEGLFYDEYKAFCEEKFNCSLADVAFRIALLGEEFTREKNIAEVENCDVLGPLKFYFVALGAINKRIEHNCGLSFDISIRDNITKKLKGFYHRYYDKIKEISKTSEGLSSVLEPIPSFTIEEVRKDSKYVTIKINTIFKMLIVDEFSMSVEFTDTVTVGFNYTSMNLDYEANYSKMKFEDNRIIFVKSKDEFEFDDDIDFDDDYDFDEEDYVDQEYFINYKSFDFYSFNRMFDEKDILDEPMYKCARACYSMGGKVYTFLCEIEGLSIGHIYETMQEVYIVDYVELCESELPVSIEKMKHIVE